VSGLVAQLGPMSPQELGSLLLSLALTLGLMLLIGWTYQTTHKGALYTQQFVHTLVLVGLVVSVVLRIVGQNLAAGLAIFGAFSIVRFRNAVPETRDVGFIFLAMVVGLASGSGQSILAIATTLLVCSAVWLLWRTDAFAPQSPSHILRIRTTNEVDYDEAFRPIFAAYTDRVEMLRVESVQGGMLTEITYGLRMHPGASTRDMLTELQQVTGNNRVILTAAGVTADR
jgi:uncharacterized membrane protein YhiD involved in acid resistance